MDVAGRDIEGDMARGVADLEVHELRGLIAIFLSWRCW